jgi:hypothetical protein
MSIGNHIHKFIDFAIRGGDSSFIHLTLVFPYGLKFVYGGFFRNDMSFLWGEGRSGDSLISNFNFISAGESPLLPTYTPNRKCHSELIHHAQLRILSCLGWINEESLSRLLKSGIFVPKQGISICILSI